MNKIDDLDVRLWLGNTGNFDTDDLVDLIMQIANGDYKVDQLKQDILDNKDMLGNYFKHTEAI
jgi:hypothetical protein